MKIGRAAPPTRSTRGKSLLSYARCGLRSSLLWGGVSVALGNHALFMGRVPSFAFLNLTHMCLNHSEVSFFRVLGDDLMP